MLPIILVLATSLFPSSAFAQFNSSSPACVTTCYNIKLTELSNGTLSTDGIPANNYTSAELCSGAQFQSALTNCVDDNCDAADQASYTSEWASFCAQAATATSTIAASSAPAAVSSALSASIASSASVAASSGSIASSVSSVAASAASGASSALISASSVAASAASHASSALAGPTNSSSASGTATAKGTSSSAATTTATKSAGMSLKLNIGRDFNGVVLAILLVFVGALCVL